MNKKIISAIVALVVLVAIVGGYYYPNLPFISGATAGTTNSTSKIASCVLDMSTTTMSTASTTLTGCLYNGDGADRIVTSVDYFMYGMTTATYNGTGVATLVWAMSTSTGQYATTSVNALLSTNIATTTPNLYIGSTSPGISGTAGKDFTRVWATGTYMNLTQQATSTATGSIVIRYFVSSQ